MGSFYSHSQKGMSLSQVTILSEIIHVADESPMSRYPLSQEYVIVDPNRTPVGMRTEPWRSSPGLPHDLRWHNRWGSDHLEVFRQVIRNDILIYPGRHSYSQDVPTANSDWSLWILGLAKWYLGRNLHWPRDKDHRNIKTRKGWHCYSAAVLSPIILTILIFRK